MKYVFCLSPAFTDVAVEMMSVIRKKDPGAVFIALATAAQVEAKIRKNWPDFFERVISMESLEKEWIHSPSALDVVTSAIMDFDRRLGPGTIQRIIVADRNVGGGFVTGVDIMRSPMFYTMLDRNTLLRYHAAMLSFLDGFLAAEKPDRVFLHCVAGGYTLAIGEMCRIHRVAFQHFQHARIQDFYTIDSSIKGLCDEVANAFSEGQKKPDTLDPFRVEAAAILKEYREKKILPEYIDFNRRTQQAAYKPLSIAKQIVKAGVKVGLGLIRREKRMRGYTPWQELQLSILKPIRFWITSKGMKYASPRSLEGQDYVFFPLHVDPEATTMVVSPDHTNQLAMIEQLAKKVPLHMALVVKDHFPMMGARPLWFYKRLRSIPNVVIVDPYESSLDLIRNADLVVTIAGTVAWEAMIGGRPVLVTGESAFRPLGAGMVYYPDVSGLGNAIERALSLPPVDDRLLEDWIAATIKTSHRCKIALLWTDPDRRMLDENAGVIEKFADDVIRGVQAP